MTSSSSAPPDNLQLTAWLQQAGSAGTPVAREQAFRRLSRALGQRMYALALRLTGGDAATAEDVVQEVLIKLWQVAPHWQENLGHAGSVNAYVSRLVYTTAMDAFRRRRPTVSLDESSPDDDGARRPSLIDTLAEPESITATIQRTEERHWLLAALKKIPERQQQAVVLSYFHEHRQAEVAAALGTTEKAVESLLVRARRTLADVLPPHFRQQAQAALGKA